MDVKVNNEALEAEKTAEQQIKQGRWKLYLVLLICAAPLLMSYFTYYVIKPETRSNYGTLLDAHLYPIPKLGATLLGGESKELEAFHGKWVMLQVSASRCGAACQNALLNMRQLQLMQGKDKERIERIILITDQSPIDTTLLREFDGTHFLRVDSETVHAWLPVEKGGDVQDRLYLIDPLGNLMMRYSVDADPNKIKKDIVKLLKASSIG